MTLRSRLGGVLMGLALVGGLGVLPLFAQDSAKPSEKVAAKEFRRVPPYFTKAGVTDEQRAKIYATRAKHQDKIADLKRQIDEAAAAELNECEAVLLDAQKKVLVQLRAEGQAKAKSRTKAARADSAKAEVKLDK